MRRAIESAVVVLTAACVLALVGWKVTAQTAVGPYWDSFSYLANAADFAGKGFGYTEPNRPPLLPLLTAIPLALGFVDERAVQIVDALLALVGFAGFYLLVRRRFQRPMSAVAVLALLMAPPLWRWLGAGYADIAAMGLCAWTLYFAIRATEDDARFYLAAFPAFLAAALTRQDALLFAIPLGVWLLLRAKPFRHARWIGLGIALAATLFVPFAVHFQAIAGDPLYPFVAGMRLQGAVADHGALRDIQSFIGSLHVLAAPGPLAPLTVLVLGLAAVSLAREASLSMRRRRVHAGRIAVAALVFGCAAWLARFGLAASQLAVAAGCYGSWRLLASEPRESGPGVRWEVPPEAAMDAAVAAWLIGYLIYHETWAQRLSRYYISMAPGMVYMVFLGWRSAVGRLWSEVSSIGEISWTADARFGKAGLSAFAYAPAILLLAAGLVTDVGSTSWRPDDTVVEAKRTTAWLAARADIDSAVVYSDLWPITSWYLHRKTPAMPLFDDEAAVGHELEVNDADYYITLRPTPKGYVTGFVSGEGRVVRASNAGRRPLPDVLYLGAGWENYLERLDGYGMHLVHHEGEYDAQGTVFLDAATPEQLERFHVVTAFGFLWRERSSAERSLMSWVDDGGTLVIDASRNLQPPASLSDCVLFDTVIRRRALPKIADIEVAGDFAASHPGLPKRIAARFAADDGEPWYGASYEALPGSEPLRVLASAGGRPVLAERRWGRGRVLWVGYNLFWHAFRSGDPAEAALVRAVMAEARGETNGDVKRWTIP